MKRFMVMALAMLTLPIFAQKENPYRKTDEIAVSIPKSQTRTSADIAAYISAHFTGQTEQARAIYMWIATHIEYDIPAMSLTGSYMKKSEILNDVLSMRKGICSHYAELFTDIARQVGIESYVVAGYTKQGDYVDETPHAWNAARIDSVWYLFDATWGAGYIRQNRFVKKVDDAYFRMEPSCAILTHMPFDPMWQFLSEPITHDEFYGKNRTAHHPVIYFNCTDTLTNYIRMNRMDQLISSLARMESNNNGNLFIASQVRDMERGLEYYKNQVNTDLFNAAVDRFNEGIIRFNDFIDYRQNRFMPEKADEELRQMLALAEFHLMDAGSKLWSIEAPDIDMAESIADMNAIIERVMIKLYRHKAFLEEYLNTEKSRRKLLL